MCGRYNVTPNSDAFLDVFEVMEGLDTLPGEPRYNIAPGGDPVSAVRQGAAGRQLCLLRWPLIPHWAREGKVKFSTVNAKGETLGDKPAFRNAWQRGRRCLIPANGYFEWQKAGDRKQPYHIRMPGGELFAFGGLWDRCRTNAGDVIESCTIITTPPAPDLAHIHSRMPLIIPRRAYEHWLTGDDPGSYLRPYDETALEFQPVTTFVNNPKNDDPRCLERVR